MIIFQHRFRQTCRRGMLALLCVIGVGSMAQGEDDVALLRDAVDKWSHEREAWAFTQRVREYDSDGRSQTRVERYDPSQNDAPRWSLVSIDDRAPTEKEIAAYRKRKGAKKSRRTQAPSDYVDFDRVVLITADDDTAQYAVPLRDDISRLIPLEQLTVIVTIDRARRNVRHLSISLDDPMRIALGLARVTDMNFDLWFEAEDGEIGDTPADAQPVGVAQASVSKFGDRVEFSWSDFERVLPPNENSSPARDERPAPSATLRHR